jgi:hypothetical protein
MALTLELVGAVQTVELVGAVPTVVVVVWIS